MKILIENWRKFLTENEKIELDELENLVKLVSLLKSNAQSSPESIGQSFELASSIGLLDMLIEILLSPYGLGDNIRFGKAIDGYYKAGEIKQAEQYMEFLNTITLKGRMKVIIRRVVLEHGSEELVSKIINEAFAQAEGKNKLDLSFWDVFRNDNVSEQFYKDLMLLFEKYTLKGKYLAEADYVNLAATSTYSKLKNKFKTPDKDVFVFPVTVSARGSGSNNIAELSDEWEKWARS
tara:strand:+ start:154 stop:861 length:708 start_codon:yes stop_codon:yes gene_type:complete